MSLVANRYEPVEKLGQGGMGVVYRAKDRLTDTVVALKQVIVEAGKLQFNMSQQATTTEEVALAQEFRTLATLRHPHIISVLDYGFGEGKQPFFTMEYLPGAHLITDYAADQTMQVKLRLLTEMLQALVYLHQRGIIHRDIKPGNILVDTSGRVRVLDFGLAQEVAVDEKGSDKVTGTLAYMAPELLGEQNATVQSDLFAIGVIAYEIFTGEHPFRLDSTTNLLMDLMTGTVDVSKVNSAFATFISTLMDKQPANRPDTARDAIALLYRHIEHDPPEESALIRESFLQASTFVGREQELTHLRQSMSALQTGTSSAWLIGGESGVGKSRLVEELRVRALVDGVRVLRGQVAEGGVPYQAWRDVLRQLVISTELSDLEAGILKPIMSDIEQLIGRQVADVDPLSGKANQERLALTVIDVIKRQDDPLMLVIEDLQWATESLTPITLMLPQMDTLGVMLIGTFRIDERPDLPDDLDGMQLMRLARLEPESVAQLSQSMLGEVGRQPDLVALITRETEGNVFFMVEVVRALAEEAGSLTDIGSTDLPQRVMAGGMLQVLRRRLGRMPGWAQQPLKLAAVAGRQLDADILAEAAADLDFEKLVTAGANAAVLDVVDGVWQFAHDKLRETLMMDLPGAEQATLHGQVAAAIKATYPDDISYAEALAGHWDRANEPEKALPYIMDAADRMIKITATYDRAAALLERGQVLVDEADTETRARLLVLLGALERRRADYDQTRTHLEAALNLAEDIPPLQIEALTGLGTIALQTGQFDEALQYAERVEKLTAQHEDKEGEAQTYVIRGRVADARGKFDEARTYLEKSLQLQEDIANKAGIANRLMDVGITYAKQGQFDQAEDYFTRSLAIRKELGDRTNMAGNLNNLGIIANIKADHRLAKKRFTEALEISREINNRLDTALCLENLGIIALKEQDYSEAAPLFEESLAIDEEIGNKADTAANLIYLTHVKLHLGDVLSAYRNLERGIRIAQEIKAIPSILSGVVAAAYLAFHRGDTRESAVLSGFAGEHPATPADDSRFFLEPLRVKLEVVLGSEIYDEALKESQKLSIDTALERVIDTL